MNKKDSLCWNVPGTRGRKYFGHSCLVILKRDMQTHANSFKMKTIWDDWTSLISDKQDGQTKIDRWCLQYTHTDSFQRKKFTVHCDYETVPQFTTISGNLWLNLTLSHFLEKITMSLIQPSSPTQIGQLYFYDQVTNYWKWLCRAGTGLGSSSKARA